MTFRSESIKDHRRVERTEQRVETTEQIKGQTEASNYRIQIAKDATLV
jgi:hypothetical protein